MGEVVSLSFRCHADDLRQTWQGRVLAHTQKRPLGAVVLSVLAHSYDESMPVLLRVVFPGSNGTIRPPGLISCGRIDKAGAIVADIINKNGERVKDAVLFTSTNHLQAMFRKLADDLKLTDAERKQFFICVNKWIVADRRIDPNMDPRDPEAKRLVH